MVIFCRVALSRICAIVQLVNFVPALQLLLVWRLDCSHGARCVSLKSGILAPRFKLYGVAYELFRLVMMGCI